MSALNGKEMEDKELYVGRAQKKSEREASLKQRCSMLDQTITHVLRACLCTWGSKSDCNAELSQKALSVMGRLAFDCMLW